MRLWAMRRRLVLPRSPSLWSWTRRWMPPAATTQAAFPYGRLVEENRRRSRTDREFELLDTGVFDDDRYFDVFVEYAKASPEDLLLRIQVVNRGSNQAELTVLPTLWFRNTWSWGLDVRRPRMRKGEWMPAVSVIEFDHDYYGHRRLFCEGGPDLLFTENETNTRRLYGDVDGARSEEHTSELQSPKELVCRLLL